MSVSESWAAETVGISSIALATPEARRQASLVLPAPVQQNQLGLGENECFLEPTRLLSNRNGAATIVVDTLLNALQTAGLKLNSGALRSPVIGISRSIIHVPSLSRASARSSGRSIVSGWLNRLPNLSSLKPS